MNRILDIGYCLSVPERNDGNFIIKKVLGKGASSVTYLAESDKTEHVLKECNPLGLHMHRDENGFLVPDTELNRAKFEEYLERFNAGVDKQLEFRLTDALKNTISNIQNIYHANGTVYVDMTFLTGATYDQIKDDSLHNLLKRMKALAEHIGHYHDMGYLHLDIKPQNIYTIPETPEMVIMFDFDSVVLEKDVEKTVLLSYTDSWAAPEQKMAKYRSSICKATDLFAIGEIIFHRVMGRHSNLDERFDFSKYVYDKETKIFENVNPQVFRLLDELFHKTICCAPAQRFQTAAELIAQLDRLIPLADPKEPYLVTTLPTPKDFFIGRDAEFEDIHARLQQSPVLFLHGIGGIGKSELAKQYAKKYRSEYDTVVFAPYITDIVSMIADDTYVHINHFERFADEKIEEYYERKLRKIKTLIGDNGARVLFLVDNFDTADDPHTNVLTELGCRVLVTSRVDYSQHGRAQKDIREFADLAIARQLFDHYYETADEEENADIDAIIGIVQGHTLAVELIAKQIEAEWSTAKEIRVKLEAGGLSAIGDETVDNEKDGVFAAKSAFGHIKALFDMSIFEKEGKENELYVLANLSLIPYTGIDRKLFAKWCELDKYGGKGCITNLVKYGWIYRKDHSIWIHPLLSEIIVDKIVQTNYGHLTLLKNAIHCFDDDYLCDFSKFQVAKLIKNITIKLTSNNIRSKTSIDFIYEAVQIFSEYGDLDKAISCCQTGLMFLVEIGIEDSLKTFWYNDRLGRLYLETRKHNDEAEQCFVKALNICQSSSMCNKVHLRITYANMAIALYQKGQLDVSEKLNLKSLAMLKKHEPSNRKEFAVMYNNFAKLYYAQNKFEKAEEYYKKSIQTYAEENASCAQIYYNMGDFYFEQNNVQLAEEYYIKAINMFSKLYGNLFPKVARLHRKLATVYFKLNRLQAAEKQCMLAIDIYSQLFDNAEEWIADIYTELAKGYRTNHLTQSAEQYYKKANEIKIKLFGMNSNDVSTSYGNMGVFYQEVHENILAEEYYLKAIAILKAINQDDSQGIAIYCYNLGTLYHEQSDYIESERLYLKALDIYLRECPNEHQHIVRFCNTLANLYIEQGMHKESKKYELLARKHSKYK